MQSSSPRVVRHFASGAQVDEEDTIDVEVNDPSDSQALVAASSSSNDSASSLPSTTGGAVSTTVDTLKLCFSIALPAGVTQLLRFASGFMTTVYCGRSLDSATFAAVATGLSFTSLTALSIGAGIASALDTLSTQAFGKESLSPNDESRNEQSSKIADDTPIPPQPQQASLTSPGGSPLGKKSSPSSQGMYLRQSLLVTYAVYLPICLLYFFSGPFISLVVADDMAGKVILFLQLSFLIVVPMMATNNLIKFAQSQREAMLGFYASLLGLVSLPIILWIVRPQSVASVVGALALNRWIMLFIVLVLVARHATLRESWGDGWVAGFRAGELTLKRLGAFFKVGMPSLIANCADTWSFEIMAIVAASIGPVAAASWSVLMTIYGVTFACFVGLAAAGSVTVGNAIGRGSSAEAHLHARVVLFLTLVIGAVFAVCLYLFGVDVFGWIQTNPDVSAAGGTLLHLAAVTLVMDVVFYVMQGVFRGVGRQKECAISVVVGMWLVAVPCALVFAKVLHGGVFGILGGLTCGLAVSTPLQFIYLFCVLNWEQCVVEAHNRHAAHADNTQQEMVDVAVSSQADRDTPD